MHPNWGPRSGGTLLSIRGTHLNIGSEIHLFVGNQECLVLEHEIPSTSSSLADDEAHLPAIISSDTPSERHIVSEEETVQCRTSKLATVAEHSEPAASRFVKRQALWVGSITISIDNFTETYSNMTYSYTEVTIYEWMNVVCNYFSLGSTRVRPESIFWHSKRWFAVYGARKQFQLDSNTTILSRIPRKSDVYRGMIAARRCSFSSHIRTFLVVELFGAKLR